MANTNTKKKKKNPKKTDTVRNENLKGYVNDLLEFAGKIVRVDYKNYKEGDEECAVLIAPLYAKINKKWTYVDHAWVKLKVSYAGHMDEIIGFIGEVQTYHLGLMVTFDDLVYLGKDEERYAELRFGNIDIDRSSLSKRRKREWDRNVSIIRAYEFGSRLPQKLDRSELLKQVQFFEDKRKRKRSKKKHS